MRKSKKKKHRDCTECIAYCNMIGGSKEMRCGLGFVVEEIIEGGYGSWAVLVQPYNDECDKVSLPKTKEEFVRTAATLGIEWDIKDVLSIDDLSAW